LIDCAPFVGNEVESTMKHSFGTTCLLHNLAHTLHIDSAATVQNPKRNPACAQIEKAFGIDDYPVKFMAIVAKAARPRSKHDNYWHARDFDRSFHEPNRRRQPAKFKRAAQFHTIRTGGDRRFNVRD
jgi:hypothetical protein